MRATLIYTVTRPRTPEERAKSHPEVADLEFEETAEIDLISDGENLLEFELPLGLVHPLTDAEGQPTIAQKLRISCHDLIIFDLKSE